MTSSTKRSTNRLSEYQEGLIYNGRIFVTKVHKSNRWFMLMRCVECGKETVCLPHDIGLGKGCVCERYRKTSITVKERYGVDNISQHVDNKKIIAEKYKEETDWFVPGTIINGRECLSKIKQKTKWLYEVRCTKCQTVRLLGKSRLLSDTGCRCRAAQKSRISHMNKRGVIHHFQIPSILDKAMNSRDATMRANGFRSKGEQQLDEYVSQLGLKTTHLSSGAKEVDIYIKEKNIGIEFNGTFYHSEQFRPDPKYHLNKLQYYKDHSIKIIQIWEHDWNKRQEQVKNFLQSKLGKNSHRVGVRKCEVVVISARQAREFSNLYHIQGGSRATTYALGAFYDGQLIAVCSFARHHRDSRKIVLNRLCSKTDWTCSGFLGKAVKLAFKYFSCPIITWVDRCLSEGESYSSAGFKLDATLPPDYFYFNKTTKEVTKKQMFRKIDSRTERQRAIDEGMLRVYDCGKIRFIYQGDSK